VANESLAFDILARDRASQTVNNIGRSVEGLESKFGQFQRTTRNIFSGLAGVEVGRSILEAADHLELSRSRLESVTQNIGGNFEEISSQVTAADEKLAKFGYTSAETEGALATLEAVTKDPTKALGDLGLAADIARGRNISLGESVAILSRIETGHVAMLSRLGIATKDAAGNTLTQAQALQMLSQLYGGAASKYAETFAGKQAAVRAEISNSAAQIGVALLPAAVQLANVLSHDLLPPVVEAAHWLDQNRKTIEPLAKAVLLAVGAWKGYVLWTKAAAAANLLFGRSAAAAAEGAAATAASTSAGGAIGAGMAANLGRGAAVGAGLLTAAKYAPAAGVGGVADLGRLPSSDKDVQAAIPIAEKLIASHAKIVQSTPALDRALEIVRQRMAGNTQTARLLAQTQSELGASTRQSAGDIAAASQKLQATSSAQDALRQAMHQAAQTAADNGRALRGNTDDALANRDAVRQQVAAVFGVNNAMKTQGRSAQAQASMLDVLTQAVETNATKIYGDKGAVDALLASLGLIPGQAQAAASALSTYASSAVAADDALDPKRLAALRGQDRKTQDHAKSILDSFTTAFSPVVSKATESAAKAADSAAKKAAEVAKQRFNDLRQSMLNDLQSIRDAVRSTTDALTGFASITSAAQGTDIMGNAALGNVLRGRQQQAAKLKQFASAYEGLAHLGLNGADLHQFIAAGPDALPAMQQILRAGRGEIRQLNALERQIQTTAGRLAREDTASQDAAVIHRDLVSMPKKIGSEFRSGIRGLRVDVNLREVDRRNGMRTVAAVG